ncbi:hypothetical protein GQ53DRAFT_805701 [Thozetella sp. PMI_491]|nr:hypothetical protein GQ53DRAFT_805701 [Thozetella sp. PMI_491]
MAPSSLVDLPVEILQLMLSNLCVHCQHPRTSAAIPLDTDLGRINKHALAQLSCTNSTLRRVCQPVLFHYFVINASQKHVRLKRLRAQLSKFLRTICQRPDLGEAVRALSLLAPSDWRDVYPIDKNTWASVPEVDHLMQSRTGLSGEPGYRAGQPAKLSLRKMTVLLLANTPSLDYLVLQVPNYGGHREWDTAKPLTRLRVLTLLPSPNSLFIVQNLANFFRLVPQLEILSMKDASLLCPHHFSSHPDADAPKDCNHRPWEVLPSTLRKITISNVEIFRLPHLFDHCPSLEDLAILLISNSAWAWINVPPPRGAFEGARKTLRHLVVCMPDSGDFEQATGPSGICYQANLSLLNLELLESLEINQALLHAEVRRIRDGAVNELSLVLPRQLRALRIGYVISWSHIREQLYDLASSKVAGQLNSLVTVQVDLFASPSEQEVEAVDSTMRDAGIDFKVSVGRKERRNRKLLPPRLDFGDIEVL